jgi:Flp pilus assembly protein TadB
VTHVGSESNVTSTNETSDDVTLSYVATQSRMTALQKEEARLLELIDKAANLTDLLELEKRLTQVRTELENVTSQLLLYDNLVDFGTVNVNVREVQKLTPVEEPGFWQRITTGFTESLENLWIFLQELAIFLVVASPYLVTIGAVAFVTVLIIRLSIRRKRAAKSKKQPPFNTEVKE